MKGGEKKDQESCSVILVPTKGVTAKGTNKKLRLKGKPPFPLLFYVRIL